MSILIATPTTHPAVASTRVVVDHRMKEDAWDKHLMEGHEVTSVAAPASIPEDANINEDVVVDATCNMHSVIRSGMNSF